MGYGGEVTTKLTLPGDSSLIFSAFLKKIWWRVFICCILLVHINIKRMVLII
jgi:hypothetical protein